ncbi:MAG: abortive infection family protein [Candidatus Doudnabacteria bacterium]|nr:abortive infection family protein [Candidatus Doudnabacteria bacterium]
MLPDQWFTLKSQASRLLRARNCSDAADLLEMTSFKIRAGTNHFADEFELLHLSVPIEEYVRFEEMKANPRTTSDCKEIASAISELGHYIRFIVVTPDLEDTPDMVPHPIPVITTASVERALRDAQALIQSSGPSSAVDRVHTALHGFVSLLCGKAGILTDERASLIELFKRVRTEHKEFQGLGSEEGELKRILGALSTIIDALNTIRNRASVAHPTDKLLGDAEAVLAINSARTLLHYLDAKTRQR